MNEVLKAMQQRRSIRKYQPRLPEKALLDEVIQAGLWAASGRNKQGVIIVAITEKALRDRLSAMNCKIGGWPSDFDPFYGAPAVLLVLADMEIPTALYDGSLVLGNMMLAAHALGLGSCWIHRAKEEFASEEGKQILRDLGISGNYEGIGHCILGYAAEPPAQGAERKPGRVFYA